MQVPKLSFDFDYKLKGNILVLNLDGQGKGQIEAGKKRTITSSLHLV